MISEKKRTSSVKIAETIPTAGAPKTLNACAPTAVAPAVFAMVFNDKIAERGRSGSRFNRWINFHNFGLEFFNASTKLGVILKTTASSVEQTNERPRVPASNRNNSNIRQIQGCIPLSQ